MDRLTTFEITRILGTRAMQIANGSKPKVNSSSSNPLEIAKEEFLQGKIPLLVVRELPDGTIIEQKCDKNMINEYFEF